MAVSEDSEKISAYMLILGYASHYPPIILASSGRGLGYLSEIEERLIKFENAGWGTRSTSIHSLYVPSKQKKLPLRDSLYTFFNSRKGFLLLHENLMTQS